MPPTIPPAIAPVCDEDPPLLVGVPMGDVEVVKVEVEMAGEVEVEVVVDCGGTDSGVSICN